MDEIFDDIRYSEEHLDAVYLNRDKKIFLIRGFVYDYDNKKRYLHSLLILINKTFVTQNYADTKLIIAELKLFEKGNKQNKYTQLVRKDGDINLKISLGKTNNVYISKAEALAITSIFTESLYGFSLQRIISEEHLLDIEKLLTHFEKFKILPT